MAAGVHLEFFRTFLLHRVIIFGLQLESSAAIAVRGNGIDQGIVIGTADLKGNVGDTLFLVASHHLDQLEITRRGVEENQGLLIVWPHRHRLGLGGRVDGVPGGAFHLLRHHGAHHIDPDLAIFISGVQSVTGQMAVGRVHIPAVRVSQKELGPA